MKYYVAAENVSQFKINKKINLKFLPLYCFDFGTMTAHDLVISGFTRSNLKLKFINLTVDAAMEHISSCYMYSHLFKDTITLTILEINEKLIIKKIYSQDEIRKYMCLTNF